MMDVTRSEFEDDWTVLEDKIYARDIGSLFIPVIRDILQSFDTETHKYRGIMIVRLKQLYKPKYDHLLQLNNHKKEQRNEWSQTIKCCNDRWNFILLSLN